MSDVPERRLGDKVFGKPDIGVPFYCACGCGTVIRVIIREDRVSGRVVREVVSDE